MNEITINLTDCELHTIREITEWLEEYHDVWTRDDTWKTIELKVNADSWQEVFVHFKFKDCRLETMFLILFGHYVENLNA